MYPVNHFELVNKQLSCMQVHSFLVQGTGAAAAVASSLARLCQSTQLNCLVIFSLGGDHAALLDAVQTALPSTQRSSCPVYLTETYGIIGYDEDTQQNVELMEKGRGSEYGFVGGSGGQGCLVAGYSDGATAGHSLLGADALLSSATSMVVADGSGSWVRDFKSAHHPPQLYYGSISKSCFRLEDNRWKQVPYFLVSDSPSAEASSVGVTIFAEDQEAGPAVQSLLSAVPTGRVASSAVGLFPCYTRGVNQYGRENVESSQIVQALPQARVYGMFAHGELGPVAFGGFPPRPTSAARSLIPCTQHSMTSILALHTAPLTKK